MGWNSNHKPRFSLAALRIMQREYAAIVIDVGAQFAVVAKIHSRIVASRRQAT